MKRGVVVWMTGLPASGKSTLAARVRERVPSAVLLDGDEVRGLVRLGYGPAERERFYELLAGLAALLAAQGHIVLVPATAHERRFRERAAALAPRFVEVHVATPREECARHDPKGLYARDLRDLPGTGVPYEPPLAPDVVAAGGLDDAALERILALVGL